MQSSYDKLGTLLKEALEKGNIPQENKTSLQNYKQKNSQFKKSSHKEESKKSSPKSDKKEKQKTKKNTFLDTKEQKYITLLTFFNLFTENPKDFSTEQIREAYHAYLKKYHPDNIPNFPNMQKTAEQKTREAVEKYKEIITLKKELNF